MITDWITTGFRFSTVWSPIAQLPVALILEPHCLEEMRVSVQKYLNNLKLPQLYSSGVICNKEMDIGNFLHDF